METISTNLIWYLKEKIDNYISVIKLKTPQFDRSFQYDIIVSVESRIHKS